MRVTLAQVQLCSCYTQRTGRKILRIPRLGVFVPLTAIHLAMIQMYSRKMGDLMCENNLGRIMHSCTGPSRPPQCDALQPSSSTLK